MTLVKTNNPKLRIKYFSYFTCHCKVPSFLYNPGKYLSLGKCLKKLYNNKIMNL